MLVELEETEGPEEEPEVLEEGSGELAILAQGGGSEYIKFVYRETPVSQ
jgi:hypothetical protein